MLFKYERALIGVTGAMQDFNLLHTIIEHSPTGIILYSGPDATVKVINPAAKEIAPFPILEGHPAHENAPPWLAEEFLKRYKKMLSSSEIVRDMDRFVLGRYYSFEHRRVLLARGEWGILTIAQESTEYMKKRQHLESQLKENTEKANKALVLMETLLENIPDMIFVKDAKNLRFVRFNRAGENLLGYPREDLIGKNDYDFFPKSEADFFTSKDRTVLAEGKLVDIAEEPIHTRNKGDRTLHTKKVPIYDESGKPEYLLGISEDITERKIAEKERERLLAEQIARAEAENAVKMRDEFISIAAHELKTPLTSLGLQLQMTDRSIKPEKNEMPSPEVLTKAIKRSLKQVRSLSALVEELLDVARIQSGKISLSIEPVDMTVLIRSVTESFSEQLSLAQCDLTLNVETGLEGNWDGGRIEQVFSNLLSNIVKYAPGKQANISAKRENGFIRIVVQDHGPGIVPEKLGKIFERFERATSSRNISGLGLGLYVTKWIIDAHEGSIQVESSLGVGTKFVILLPLKSTRPQVG